MAIREYRFDIPSTVCLSVRGESTEEALEKTKELIRNHEGGISVHIDGGSRGRLYMYEEEMAILDIDNFPPDDVGGEA